MRARLLTLWDSFRSGFWFIPLLFVLVALALGLGMPVADSRAGSWVVERAPWMATTTEAARPTLSAIGGAMITVTGVVFSITVVTLSIASSQFGSRMLRNFMDDRVTQSAIGMFLATSAYCFLMMRSVRDAEGTMFTPHLSVALSMLLAMISVGMLIFYIHHVALAIQAPQVVASLAVDLDHSIERLFPEKIGDAPGDEQSEADAASQLDELDENYAPLISDREGYLQAVDAEGLIRTASDHELLIQLDIRPGAFVVCDVQIARVWPAEKLTDEIAAKLNGTMIVGKLRTPRQDVQCAIDEIVEVAVRALSPGINAPFTAMTCIDRLGAALGRLAGRKVPSPYRHDPGGQLRLVGLRAARRRLPGSRRAGRADHRRRAECRTSAVRPASLAGGVRRVEQTARITSSGTNGR